MGIIAPPPKPTVWALVYALGFFALPLITVLLIIDILLYLVFKYAFGICYGIACLF